jgi:hypothetical protein
MALRIISFCMNTKNKVTIINCAQLSIKNVIQHTSSLKIINFCLNEFESESHGWATFR